MINAAYRNMLGVCLVCGEDLPRGRVKYCSMKCYRVGKCTLTQLQLRKLRGLVRQNIRLTGKPNYAQVGKDIGCDWRTVHFHWKAGLVRRQKDREISNAKAALVAIAIAKTDLAREIAEARAAFGTTDPYKPGDLYW